MLRPDSYCTDPEVAPFYVHELYPVTLPATDDVTERWLLYSPLCRSAVLASGEELRTLSEQLEVRGRLDDDKLQTMLLDDRADVRYGYAQTPHKVHSLTILPNNICNFSCSYCYAAAGHGKTRLDIETLRTVLDFFVDPGRIERRDLYISFGGGGEPFLSWDIVKFALEYSAELAEKHGFTIGYSFASNGSVVMQEINDAIKKYHIKPNISFDIIEQVQNIQRKNYDEVSRMLDMLLEQDIIPTINTVITPACVGMQEEMVEEVHRRFPKLRRLSFDSVVDGNLFDSPDELAAFYNTYTDNFFKARRLGKQYGIEVSCIKFHNLEILKSRACSGGFNLTPQGTLSMCFFVSSPQEPLYDRFVYGRVKDGAIELDTDKFEEHINHRTERNKRCERCFLKWHCGGGCLFHSETYSDRMHEVVCDFQRKFSTIALLERFEID